MFRKLIPTILGLLLALNLSTDLAISAQGEKLKSIARQKSQILHAINVFRVGQKLKPLRFDKTHATIKATDGISSGGSISGQLHSEDGGFHSIGIVAAWSADSTDDSGVATVIVHPDGFYHLENLTPGQYYVLAISEAFVPMFYNNAINFHEATLIPLAEGDKVRGIDFRMQRTIPGTGSISGSVSGEFTDNTIAGVVVSVWSPDNPFFYGTAKTDDNGEYTIVSLKTGEYYASASKEKYLTEFYENAETITDAALIQVSEPDETGGINFTLSEGGKISGRVTDEDGDGISNAYIEAGSTLWFIKPDSVFFDSILVDSWGSAITDENGHYTVTGLHGGDYYVSVHAGDAIGRYFQFYDNAHSIDDATPVVVVIEQETTGIDFELPLTSFKGEVKGTVTDRDGNPLQNAFIRITTADDSSFALRVPLPYGTTDENGQYHIKEIPYGNYYVLANYNNQWQYVERWWPDAEDRNDAEIVTFQKNADKKVLDFKLPLTVETGMISGTVKNQTGAPLAYAFIEVTNAPDVLVDLKQQIWAYANSDSNGFYQVNGLPEGEYTASVQYWQDDNFGQQWYDHQDNYENADRLVLVENDTLTGINFDLEVKPYYGAITGVVADEETGELLHRAYIEVTPTDFQLYFRPFYSWPYYAITNESGEYSLEWLPQGEYVVTVYTNGAFEYYENAFSPENATMVQVIGGERTEIDFGITKKNDGSGVISGQVYDEFNDGFLEIAIVKATPVQSALTDPNPEAVYTAVTNFEGHYEITGLPQGEFIVYAYSPNHIGEYYDSVFDPAEANIIKVDGNQNSGVDFSLHPIYFLATDFRSLEGSPTVNATVLGKISDINNTPISEAFVYLMNEAGVPVSFARSNAQGHYELSNIALGSYKLKATHVGFGSKFNGDATTFETAEALEINNGSYEVNLVLQEGSVTSVGGNDNKLPKTVRLYSNYPNPFNPATEISFDLPGETDVRLSVYNLIGQKINELLNGKLGAGNHRINWNGQDNSGQSVPSGIYFYVLQTNTNRLLVRKMTLLK